LTTSLESSRVTASCLPHIQVTAGAGTGAPEKRCANVIKNLPCVLSSDLVLSLSIHERALQQREAGRGVRRASSPALLGAVAEVSAACSAASGGAPGLGCSPPSLAPRPASPAAQAPSPGRGAPEDCALPQGHCAAVQALEAAGRSPAAAVDMGSSDRALAPSTSSLVAAIASTLWRQPRSGGSCQRQGGRQTRCLWPRRRCGGSRSWREQTAPARHELSTCPRRCVHAACCVLCCVRAARQRRSLRRELPLIYHDLWVF
jgi:hypothetical protein